MSQIELAKPEVRVVTGTMPVFGRISSEDGNVLFEKMNGRAQWSLVRLQEGSRVKADALISEKKSQVADILGVDPKTLRKESYLPQFMEEYLPTIRNPREIQFILEGDTVKAVASTKHLLIPPEEVMRIAQEAVPGMAPNGIFPGLVEELGDSLPGLDISFNLHPGNILTREAIRMGYAIKVLLCTNPLMSIGVSGLNRFTYGTSSFWDGKHMGDRILRVESKHELGDRIKGALEGSRGALGELKEVIENSKKILVTPAQAKILMTAYPKAYSVGDRVTKQVHARYFNYEEQTLWGLAQAASYVARHGKFSKNAKHLDAGLATIGAAYIGITDIPETVNLSEVWLKKKGIDKELWL